jgi:bacillithiol system protein YtxJ
MNWKILNSEATLEEAIYASFAGFVIIFKHSTTCSISHMAKLRLEEHWDVAQAMIYYLDLKAYRNISDTVSDWFKVHHESPQILLIRNGECVHDASHFDITADEIQEVMHWQSIQLHAQEVK